MKVLSCSEVRNAFESNVALIPIKAIEVVNMTLYLARFLSKFDTGKFDEVFRY